MAGGVAHELRNPLNVVKTSVYFLLNARNPSPEKTSEHLRESSGKSGMADGVITALNDFAKLPAPSLQAVLLEPQFKEILELHPLPPEVEMLLEFSLRLPSRAGRPQSTADCVQQSDSQCSRRDAQRRRYHHSRQANGCVIEISVADTGVGIKQEDLDRIMEPLYTTKARGIGLGLAIARAILDKHNGRLTVTSDGGRGTTFVVSLPAG